jgi:hypothetical protein
MAFMSSVTSTPSTGQRSTVERQGAHQAGAGLDSGGNLDVSGSPAVEVDVIGVETTRLHRSYPPRVGPYERVLSVVLVRVVDRGLKPGTRLPRRYSLAGEIDNDLVELVGGRVIDVGERLPPERLSRRPGQHLALGRLLELDDRKHGPARKPRVALDQRKGAHDLVTGERLERMRASGRRDDRTWRARHRSAPPHLRRGRRTVRERLPGAACDGPDNADRTRQLERIAARVPRSRNPVLGAWIAPPRGVAALA